MQFFKYLFVTLVGVLCLPVTAMEDASIITVYSIEETDAPYTLTVRMNPVPPRGGTFTLHCNDFIQSQVENLTCDGKTIKESSHGSWSIPKDVHDLRWQVRLKEGKNIDVANKKGKIKLQTDIL